MRIRKAHDRIELTNRNVKQLCLFALLSCALERILKHLLRWCALNMRFQNWNFTTSKQTSSILAYLQRSLLFYVGNFPSILYWLNKIKLKLPTTIGKIFSCLLFKRSFRYFQHSSKPNLLFLVDINNRQLKTDNINTFQFSSIHPNNWIPNTIKSPWK